MKNRISVLFAFMALLLVVSLACKVFSGTQSPPDTQASDQPQLTKPPVQPTEPPVQPTEPPVQPPSAQEFFTEEFDGDISNWSYFTSKNDTTADDSGVQPVAQDGFLLMDIGKNLNLYATYDPFTYDNVRLDVRVENRGTNNNNINLICRYSDEGWYEIAIANNGKFWFLAFDGVKNSYARLADGGSNKIKAGKETNEYTLICNDRNLRLLINGVETRTYTDNQYVFRDGKVGVGLSSFEYLPVKVEFDWVKISQP